MFMQSIKNYIKGYSKVYKILQLINLFRHATLKNNSNRKLYPKVLQFPITNRCNSKCVMCNIHRMPSADEMTVEEFRVVIEDPIFRDIEAVGINGGEPFLFPYLIEFVEEIIKLPKLRGLNIISNGFATTLILNKIQEIYLICKKNGILFHISFSLDGYNEVHNVVRGVPNVFEKTIRTIDAIYENQAIYCDNIDIGCTIIKQNIDYLVELETFAALKKYKIKYRLGIENERLGNQDTDSYSVIQDETFKQTAMEFFFKQIFKANNFYDKFKYYAIFKYLSDGMSRALGCDWQQQGITLDSRGNVYYCAVKSKKIGNLLGERGNVIFFSEKNLDHRKEILDNDCEKCIHDYAGRMNIKYLISFILFLLKERYWIKQYEGNKMRL